jgi:hypothetical protein
VKPRIIVAALACAVLTPSMAGAAAPPPAAPALAVPEASRALARQFVAIFYPTIEKDLVDQLAAMSLEPVAQIESVSFRRNIEAEVRIALKAAEPVLTRQAPALREAIVQSFARRFSDGELRDLIAFGSTPTGRKFLENTNFAQDDPAVGDVHAKIIESVVPLFERVSKTMCRRNAELRVAAGEKDAKCSMA